MPELLVLCYHAVAESWDHEMSIRPADLRRQLMALRRRGYHPSTFSKAVLSPRQVPTVVVTFDDAFASVYTEAYPILHDLGFPATLFVPTSFPSSRRLLSWSGFDPGSACPPEHLTPATWRQIGELAAAGWEVGSHTQTHPRLTQLDDASARAELNESKRECEDRIGQPCQALAYPFGDSDRRILELTAEAGYAGAATLDRRRANPHNLSIGRVGVYRRNRRFSFAAKTSRLTRTQMGDRMIVAGRRSTTQVAKSLTRLRRAGRSCDTG